MKLDLNFNALTKLREWWRTVLENFKIIERECTETRKIADNACTKEQAQAYVAEFAGAAPEYMAAIEEFTRLYNESGSSVDAMEAFAGKRLKYYRHDETETIIETPPTEDAVHFCKYGVFNEGINGSGIMVTFANKEVPDTGFMMWIDADGIFYVKINGEWQRADNGITDRLSAVEEKCVGVTFGTYTGDGAESRTISLGFTPDAVEIYLEDGTQVFDTYAVAEHYGGLAIKDKPCKCSFMDDKVIFEVCEGGFKIYKWTDSKDGNPDHHSRVNENGKTYYYKAYRK